MTSTNHCGESCSPTTETTPATRAAETPQRYAPRVDIREVTDGIELTADLPGVTEQDLEILLDKHFLTIRGKVSSTLPAGAEPVYQEYGVGDYERVFTLPADIDQERIAAKLNQGVLRLHLPRVTPPGVRRIAVATSA